MWVTLSLRKKELQQEHSYYQLQDLQISRQKRQLDRRKRYEQSLIQRNQKLGLAPIKERYETAVAAINKNKQILSDYFTAVKNLQTNPDNYEVNGKNVYGKCDSGQYVFVESGDNNLKNKFCKIGTEVVQNGDLYYNVTDTAYANGLTCTAKANDANTDQRYNLVCSLSGEAEAYISSLGLSTDLSAIDSSTDISTIESSINNARTSLENERQSQITKKMEESNTEKEIWENELQMLEDEVGDEETQLELEQTDIETQMEYVSTELQAIKDAASQGIQQSVIQLK